MSQDNINKTVTIMLIGILCATLAFAAIGYVHWALSEPQTVTESTNDK